MIEIRRENGIALVITLLALLLLMALGILLALSTSLETMIARNFRESEEAFYAADAAVERAMDDIVTAPDWGAIAGGSAQSAFVDGVPSGLRTLADGSTVDLAQVVNRANCQRFTSCTNAEMDLVTVERPWGAKNPRWRPYAYGHLRDLMPPGAIDSSYYVVVLVAGDLALRAEAFGPRGVHMTIEATIARAQAVGAGSPGVRILSWRHVRE